VNIDIARHGHRALPGRCGPAAAESGEIIASRVTIEGSRFVSSNPRSLQLKGLAEPMDVVTIEWK